MDPMWIPSAGLLIVPLLWAVFSKAAWLDKTIGETLARRREDLWAGPEWRVDMEGVYCVGAQGQRIPFANSEYDI